MNIGMLWFDRDKSTSLKDKIERAAAYYKNKYGKQPNICFLHESSLSTNEEPTPGIEIRPDKSMLPDHFWIGVQDEKEKQIKLF